METRNRPAGRRKWWPLLLLAPVLAWAQSLQEVRDFSIAPQSLGSALIAFSGQADLQVLSSATLTGGKRSGGVTGRMSAEAALGRLLAGSGLSYRQSAGGTVTIMKAPAAAPSSAPAPMPREDASTAPPPRELDAVRVTGSRLNRTEVETASPVMTITRADIERSGASTVREILVAIPQNSVATDESGSNTALGASTIQLRGLSVGSTLVLLNGRRLSGYNESYFDLNSLPLDIIERIDVLTDTASAVYGADAIGGAVNFVTRRGYQGASLALRYGTSARTDATERQASFGFGGGGERFSGMAVITAFDRDPLYARDRELTRTSDFTRYGGPDRRNISAYPANVYALPGAGNLPGLGHTFAAVPAGTDGIGLTPADFAATSGTLNLFDTSPYQAIVPESRRLGLFAAGEANLAAGARLFGEFLFSRTEQKVELSPASVSGGANGIYVVPAHNPFNPFGVPVGVNYRFVELGPRMDDARIDYARLLVGAQGQVFGRFDWEVSLLADRNDTGIGFLGNIDAAAVRRYLDSADPAVALNLFSTTGNNNPATLEAIRSPFNGRSVLEMRIVEAILRGGLFELPAGELQVAAGGSIRWDDGSFLTQASDLAGKKRSSALFAEALFPLVSPDWGIPGLHSAELSAAVRRDDYDSFGGVTNPQLGLKWRLLPNLLLRASWGKAFKPPTLRHLYNIRVEQPSNIPDPLRNGEVSNFLLISGGNPDTLPEKAESLTYGLVWEPAALPGLSTGLSFFRVKHDDLIGNFDYNQVLTNPQLFGDRIVRAAPTPADIAAGLPGTLLSLDATTMNYGFVEVKGADFDLRYAFPETVLGRFVWSSLVSYVDEYNVQLSPGAPIRNDVGRSANRAGYPSRVKASSQLGWSGDSGLSASVTARYLHGYYDYDNVNRLPSETLYDLQLAYDGGAGGAFGWPGARVSLGVVNLTDQQGHYANNFAGYDFSQADLRGRYFYLSLQKEF